MKVLVTGAAGFIGSHVMQKLISSDHEVVGLISPNTALTRLKPLSNHFDTISCSLEDTSYLRSAIRSIKPDTCIHLAWYAKPEIYLHENQNLKSLWSSISFFETLIENGCRHIIGAGTCFEYDTSIGYLKEDTPTCPASLYSAAKLSCFHVGAQMALQAGIDFSWCRIFSPYGPMDNPQRLVSACIAALRKGIPFLSSPGDQIRDYIHVADVAQAFLAIIEGRAGGIYNVSTAIPVSVRTILEIIGQLMSRIDLIKIGTLSYRNFDPPFVCGNNNRLKEIGWKPIFSLTEGLAQTINSADGHIGACN
jgi:UDP-glucuronate decarboxylase